MRTEFHPHFNRQSHIDQHTEDPLTAVAAVAAAQGFGGFGGLANLPSNVVPAPSPGTTYRFSWSTPMVMSPHNPRMIYAGSDRLFKSVDRGDTWVGTQDLTKSIDRSTLSIMGVSGKDPMASKNDGYNGYGYIVTLQNRLRCPVFCGLELTMEMCR